MNKICRKLFLKNIFYRPLFLSSRYFFLRKNNVTPAYSGISSCFSIASIRFFIILEVNLYPWDRSLFLFHPCWHHSIKCAVHFLSDQLFFHHHKQPACYHTLKLYPYLRSVVPNVQSLYAAHHFLYASYNKHTNNAVLLTGTA